MTTLQTSHRSKSFIYINLFTEYGWGDPGELWCGPSLVSTEKPPGGGFRGRDGRRLPGSRCARHLHRGMGLRALVGKVVAIPEVLVELAGQLRSARTESRPSAFEEKHRDQAAWRCFGVRNNPAETRPLVGAGSGLAKDRQFLEVGAQAASGSILHGASHAVLQVRHVARDVERPLHLGLKCHDLFGRSGMLEVVERSAVGDGGYKRAELQRRHGYALSEAAHAAHAAFGCGKRLARIFAELLALDVVPSQFAQTELRGVVANALKSKFAAEFFKIEVVALGDGIRHVHAEPG